MKKKILAGLAMVLFGSVGSINAALMYDESLSGDLNQWDSYVLDLQVGTNSILGSSHFDFNGSDFDGFYVSLGADLVLTNIDYNISNLSTDSETWLLKTYYSMRDGAYINVDGSHLGTTLATTVIDVLGPTSQSMFDAALPLDGSFKLLTSTGSMLRSGEGGGAWDYEIVFTVESAAPVPEPTTMLLFGVGLAGVAGVSRRKKK